MNPLKTSIILITLAAVQLACNIQGTELTPDTFSTLDGLYTASALTQEAYTATPGSPPLTIPPPLPITPLSTSNCDTAEFIEDVSFPDGTLIDMNAEFTKSWLIKNIGTCAWTPSYALVFIGGDSMNAPAIIPLGAFVKPGETINLSIALKAPSIPGRFTGYWKLRNESGTLFGIGEDAQSPFWAEIVVKGKSHIAYDFASNYCNAEWSNGNEPLPCPGPMGSDKGYVIKLDNPVLENGKKENEPGLLVFPENINKGTISGQYPSFTVKSGDHFRAIINCAEDAIDCDVFFKLEYKTNGVIKTYAEWQEINEGEFYPVDIDLSPLAGKTLKFILTVSSTGNNEEDRALWLNPHILRQGNP